MTEQVNQAVDLPSLMTISSTLTTKLKNLVSDRWLIAHVAGEPRLSYHNVRDFKCDSNARLRMGSNDIFFYENSPCLKKYKIIENGQDTSLRMLQKWQHYRVYCIPKLEIYILYKIHFNSYILQPKHMTHLSFRDLKTDREIYPSMTINGRLTQISETVFAYLESDYKTVISYSLTRVKDNLTMNISKRDVNIRALPLQPEKHLLTLSEEFCMVYSIKDHWPRYGFTPDYLLNIEVYPNSGNKHEVVTSTLKTLQSQIPQYYPKEEILDNGKYYIFDDQTLTFRDSSQAESLKYMHWQSVKLIPPPSSEKIYSCILRVTQAPKVIVKLICEYISNFPSEFH